MKTRPLNEITITIAGGGLAGLALGVGLRRHGVRVRLLEAGSYPRHRVCGEFICGVEEETLDHLGIAGAFEPKVLNRTSQWFYRGRPVLKRILPTAAIGISRHHLDAALADQFVRLGGQLETRVRAKPEDLPHEGTIWTAGRQRVRDGQWLGLKCHVRDYGMDTDLQMHFGDSCYIGMSRVERDTVNVCGIFKKRRNLKVGAGREQRLFEYLRASELGELAEKITAAEIVPDSLLGVSAFQLGPQPDAEADDGTLRLGDAYSMIPPFTGNGMTMAFQAAEHALLPVLGFARGEQNWNETTTAVRAQMRRRLTRRVRWAMGLHPLLLTAAGQRTLVTIAQLHAIPFGLFFRKTR